MVKKVVPMIHVPDVRAALEWYRAIGFEEVTTFDDIDGLYARLKDRVDVVEPPHDTFYGMRELIIRDLNRFWITFGCDIESRA
jgi:uncharacterized glyoxalase superfamily protein PhnB